MCVNIKSDRYRVIGQVKVCKYKQVIGDKLKKQSFLI